MRIQDNAVLVGIHAVRHALMSGDTVCELNIEKGKHHPRINELVHLARKAQVRVSFLPRQALDRLAGDTPHQGAVAKISTCKKMDFREWLNTLNTENNPMVLLLDGVTDPHNLGACIRTAEAAGCAAVVIPKDHAADTESPVVAKSACGALSRLPVLTVTNLVRAMKQLQDKGLWLVGLAGESRISLYQPELSGSLGLVMGAEGQGMRRLVREQCDELLSIPMPGHIESLNVSVATGVVLFEIVRQRGGID